MSVYFNENDRVACAVLRANYEGHVDDRSIKDVEPDDVRAFNRVHWFAGAGLWEVAAIIARWPAHLQVWTASCPCQPFSVAGKGAGVDDPRHLWPDLFRLIRTARPARIVGEQVAGKPGDAWFDGVCSDLESIGYSCRAVEVPASAVDAPQKRSRNWWVAMGRTAGATSERGAGSVLGAQAQVGREDGSQHGHMLERPGHADQGLGSGPMAGSDSRRCYGRPQDAQRGEVGRTAVEWTAGSMEHATHGPGRERRELQAAQRCFGVEQGEGRERGSLAGSNAGSFWAGAELLDCADGKARRTKPGLRLLVDGMAGRTDLWRLAGNSIVPWVAAQVLTALIAQVEADTDDCEVREAA